MTDIPDAVMEPDEDNEEDTFDFDDLIAISENGQGLSDVELGSVPNGSKNGPPEPPKQVATT